MIRILMLLFLLSASCAMKLTNQQLLSHLRKCTISDKEASKESIADLTRKFQKNVGLQVTGLLDADTTRILLTSKCGAKGIGLTARSRRTKRYTLQGSKWYRKDLKYKFMSYPINLEKAKVEKVMRDVFDEWSNYTDLSFTRTEDSNEADIKIEFSVRYHKDEFPFDGPDVALAHGFYPSYGGDIHFDNEEIWSIEGKPQKGTNLFHVALHEIGHSLGVDHSSSRTAVMYAYEIEGLKDFHLKADDINAIQAIYGPKTTSTTTTIELLCNDPKIDALITGRDGKLYMLKNQYYWQLNLHSRKKFSSKPKLIQDQWPGLPANVDAAFTDNLGRTFFFRKTMYYVHRGKKAEFNEPQKIKNGFPKLPAFLNAAFSKPGDTNELYFFKKDKLYKYVRARFPHVGGDYPKNVTDVWPDVPTPLDAAFRANGTTYFFKGPYYYSVNDEDATNTTEPQKVSKQLWLDCKDFNGTQHQNEISAR